MKKIPGLFYALCALLVVLNQSLAAPASTGQTGFRLAIELQDGSRIIGKSGDETFQFHSDVLGELKLPLDKIRSIECQPKTNSVKLTTANGDSLAAQFTTQELKVEAAFGDFKLPVNLVRSVKVSRFGRLMQMRPELVSLWSGEGNANDSAGDNSGQPAGRLTYAEGKIGQAFRLDGVNSFVKIPQSPSLNLSDHLTVSFWMKADPDNSMGTVQGLFASDFYVIEISSGYGGRMGVNFAVSTTANQSADWNGWQRGVTTVADYTHISQVNGGGAPVTSGEWHHIAATYDGSKLQLYVDGRPWGNPISHTGSIRPMLSKSFITIGSEDGRTTCPDCLANRYFKGLIDEIAVYDCALSAAEIQTICVEENNDELPPLTSPSPARDYSGQIRFGR